MYRALPGRDPLKPVGGQMIGDIRLRRLDSTRSADSLVRGRCKSRSVVDVLICTGPTRFSESRGDGLSKPDSKVSCWYCGNAMYAARMRGCPGSRGDGLLKRDSKVSMLRKPSHPRVRTVASRVRDPGSVTLDRELVEMIYELGLLASSSYNRLRPHLSLRRHTPCAPPNPTPAYSLSTICDH